MNPKPSPSNEYDDIVVPPKRTIPIKVGVFRSEEDYEEYEAFRGLHSPENDWEP